MVAGVDLDRILLETWWSSLSCASTESLVLFAKLLLRALVVSDSTLFKTLDDVSSNYGSRITPASAPSFHFGAQKFVLPFFFDDDDFDRDDFDG